MTNDLEILKELFLPLLEEMSSFSSGLSRNEKFWDGFNDALLGTSDQLRDILTDHKITGIERYAKQFESLKAEYIAWLAQYYCAGNTSPAITLLLGKADAAFIEEVAFQKDMLAAITLAGRDEIRNELQLNEEFADEEFADEEISGAFRLLHRDAGRNELRKRLRAWEEETAVPKPAKRKRIGAIPLLFLRLAAAAAVGAVATIGVVKVYKYRQEMPAVKYNSDTSVNKPAGQIAAIDTAAKANTVRPNITAATGADSPKTKTAKPYIILKGSAVDTTTSELVTDVAISMLDEKGKTQTTFSKDGTFRLRLPLHHDYVITGKKDGYHSARLSLSTMDAREEDAGEVVEVVLRFIKDP